MDLSPIDVDLKEDHHHHHHHHLNGYHLQSSSGGSSSSSSTQSRNSGKSVKFNIAMFEPETGNDSVGVSSYGGSSANSMIMHHIPEHDDEDLAQLDDEVIE